MSTYRDRSILCFIVLYFLIIGININAQSQPRPLSFHHLTAANGLSEGTNAWVYRDSQGFMWISSLDGLNRFDGQSVRTYKYDPSDNHSICDNIITSTFFEDENGDLWFTSYGGINVYRRKYDHFDRFQLADEKGETLSADYFAFHLDTDKKLWVRTGIGENGHFHLFDTKTKIHETIGKIKGQRIAVGKGENQDESLIVSSLISGYRGIILTKLNGKNPTSSRSYFSDSPNDGPSTLVFNVLVKNSQEIWLGSTIGLIHLNSTNGAFQIFDQFKNQALGTVKSVAESENLLYVSSTEAGLLVFDKEEMAFVKQFLPNQEDALSLRSKGVSKVYIDDKQCIWVSYFENDGNGLDYAHLEKNRLSVLAIDDLEKYQANALAEDGDGNIYIAIDETLYIFDKEKNRINTWRQNGKISFLYRDQNEIIWMSIRNTAERITEMFRLDVNGDKFVPFGFFDHPTKGMCQLSNGRYLIATEDNGVIEMRIIDDKPAFRSCPEMEDLQGSFVSNIVESPDGHLFVSINFDRLSIYKNDNNQLSLQHTLTGVGECKSFYFFPQSPQVWIAASIGLIDLNIDNYEYGILDEKISGIPRRKYFNIIPIDKENIWLRTERSILNYNLSQKTYAIYNEVDGMEEVAGDFQPSMIDQLGHLWLAGKNGINMFNPDSLKTVSIPSKPQIIQIKINDEPYDSELSDLVLDSVVLDYSNSTISIEFAACEYADPKNISFKYRLLGQDTNWVQSGNRGYVRYNKLRAGKYTFQALTTNTDNFQSQNPLELFIRIQPPFWATKLAFVLYGIALLGLLGLIRYIESKNQRKKLERERIKLAQEKRVNNQLRKIDLLKDQFLANTSHELRTPLNGIIGLSDSLVAGATGELPEKTVKNLQMISSSGRRLAKLVNDILDFSKLKTDNLSLSLAEVDMYATTEIVLTLLSPLINTNDIILLNQVPEDVPLITADENRIQQILYNLVGNAIKFTNKGEISISTTITEDQLITEVSDTGVGIPEEKFEEIFSSFQQVDGSDTRSQSGAGLGLSVAKQLVELHGGEITVASTLDEGSTFSFSIPLSKVDRKDATLNTQQNNALVQALSVINEDEDHNTITAVTKENNNINILVVDDEPVNRTVLENHLSTAGYNVVQASNGKTAINIAEKHTFNLIILDIMMPGMSGLEVCKILRTKFPASELPIIMLTAKNSVGDLVKGFTVGANDYLAKPFSRDELLTRIKTHINLHQIFKATGKFVPYKFLNAIGRQEITEVQLGDHTEVEVTVMFADIREFTRISESMTPTENFNFVNDFVGRLGPIIQKNQGFVNQYLGDGIMAIFPKKPEDAVAAAVAMLKDIERDNQIRLQQGKEAIKVGIGLHTGPLVMGIIGDENRTDPATIADTVNISSRLEGLTKHFGTNLIVSKAFIDHKDTSENFHFRYLGKVRLKGKKEAIGIYECIDGDAVENKNMKIATRLKFEHALTAYETGNFRDAISIFNEIILKNPQDAVSAYFHSKAIFYKQNGTPRDWQGIESMDNK